MVGVLPFTWDSEGVAATAAGKWRFERRVRVVAMRAMQCITRIRMIPVQGMAWFRVCNAGQDR